VNKNKIILATLLIGGLGIVLLSGEDDPVPATSVQGQAPSGPRTPQYAAPAQPKTGTITQRYPAPSAGGEANSQARSAPSPWSVPTTDEFRFRPLTERERARYSPSPGSDQGLWRPIPGQPSTPALDSDARWAQEGYRFRPIQPSPIGGTRWEAPESRSPRGQGPGASGRWADQLDPPPWLGPTSTPQPATSPPAQRMLPSLDWSDSRTFSAR